MAQGIDFAIFLMGSFEPGTVKFYSKVIKPGDWVLDIGANIGAHTLRFAKLVCDSGRVIAFEPTDFAFTKLKRNLGLNPVIQNRVVARQTLLNSGLMGKPDSIPSSWDLKENKGLSKHPIHQGSYQPISSATSETLDDSLMKMGNPNIQFIKIDVDGFELDVLKGAQNTLERCRPHIIMELAPCTYQEHGYTLADLLSILPGYDVLDFNLNPQNLKKIPKGGGINVFLRNNKTQPGN